MKFYTERDIQTLSDDEEARKELVLVFLKVHRALINAALGETIWGPANDVLSQVRNRIDAQLARISEQKREK